MAGASGLNSSRVSAPRDRRPNWLELLWRDCSIGSGLGLRMELTFECPNCEAIRRIPAIESEYQASCSNCSYCRELDRSATSGGVLSACPWCRTEDLYLQKDFPHGLGLAIVISGFVISSVFWWYYMPIWAFAILLGTAAIDVALYYLVPDVTICYRCLSQYRGGGTNPEGKVLPFDLAIGERYRQERIRIEEIRASESKPS